MAGQGRGEDNYHVRTPCALYLSASLFEKGFALQEELQVPLHIHLAETADEVEQIRREYQLTPTQLLRETGVLERPVLAAHCVHLTEEDMDILKAYDVHVAHNPGSILKLGSGVAPLPDLLARGITVGLGTDGAASNNNLDMMEEMRLAALLHKGVRQDPTAITAADAFMLATRESAKAVLEQAGMISEGMKVDRLWLIYSAAWCRGTILLPTWYMQHSLQILL